MADRKKHVRSFLVRIARQTRSTWVLSALLLAPATRAGGSDDVAALAQRIKAVSAEGAGNAAASEASRKLARLGPDSLVAVLLAMDDANPKAANWLRAAVDAIAEQAIAAERPLPTGELERFVLDRNRAGPVRRLAFEWLCRVDATAADRLVPGMIDDPAVELRRDAVARAMAQAQQLLQGDDKPAATAAYRKSLDAARDRDQVLEIAKQLESLGEKPDLTRHFGCLQRWRLIAPFDNTGKAGFAAAHPPEKEIKLDSEYDGKAVKVQWREHVTADQFGMVDLNKVIGKHMGVVAYAMAEIESPESRAVRICVGTPNAVKVWLNGKLVLTKEEYHHGASMDQYVAACQLQPGRNTLMLKICQNEQKEEWAQNWMFQARICDLTGKGL
jgi:hypothetical protein